jgi:hypothetical protein
MAITTSSSTNVNPKFREVRCGMIRVLLTIGLDLVLSLCESIHEMQKFVRRCVAP